MRQKKMEKIASERGGPGPSAEGVWYLKYKEWGDQATPLMDALTELCGRLGVPQHDIERNGKKGFYWLREGFCTTAKAMRKHFKDLKDDNNAANSSPPPWNGSAH